MIEYDLALESDIPGIQRVALDTWRATYARIYSSEFIERFVQGAYAAESLREAIIDPHAIFVVARADEQVVGYGHVKVRDLTAELLRLYVLPAYQQQGIGSELLRLLEFRLRDLGARSLWCHVHQDNYKSVAFYERHGFEHVPAEDKGSEWYMLKPLPRLL